MNPAMAASTLETKQCVPCEGGVAKYSLAEATAQVAALPAWRLSQDGTRIRRDWQLKSFRDGIRLINTIGALAEREQHHPDLHLENYRDIRVEIYTHAIGGLSENDFILAAKIDTVAPPSRN
jgi:4a-hydroxytetrahydrobiopterin dehydratase